MNRCLFCGEVVTSPDHWMTCDGRQGHIEASEPDIQVVTFDVDESRAARERGMHAAAVKRSIALGVARELSRAIALADLQRLCDMDRVYKRMIPEGYLPKDLGNAAGSVFKTGEWIPVGWCSSSRVSNHSRQIMVWRLR